MRKSERKETLTVGSSSDDLMAVHNLSDRNLSTHEFNPTEKEPYFNLHRKIFIILQIFPTQKPLIGQLSDKEIHVSRQRTHILANKHLICLTFQKKNRKFYNQYKMTEWRELTELKKASTTLFKNRKYYGGKAFKHLFAGPFQMTDPKDLQIATLEHK
ncbi:unnamed protein product [Schistosoma curassoni]|uniref:Chromosome 1 open reading frame 141 n=1 Tax=Schistosoma curassoni TaxID=6186 RepID=A0A183JY58_9TREM|nr:unnamed protein product [Schistosoma curassoni]